MQGQLQSGAPATFLPHTAVYSPHAASHPQHIALLCCQPRLMLLKLLLLLLL